MLCFWYNKFVNTIIKHKSSSIACWSVKIVFVTEYVFIFMNKGIHSDNVIAIKDLSWILEQYKNVNIFPTILNVRLEDMLRQLNLTVPSTP